MPRALRYTLVLAILASWIPLALVVKARTTINEKTPLHLFFDMDEQNSYGAQDAAGELAEVSRVFADGRVMRPPVEGTVARTPLAVAGGHLLTGLVGGEPAESFPPGIEVDMDLLRRGRQRYEISCAPCHGDAGYGDGLVARRAEELQEGTWTPPSSLHTELVRSRAPGHVYGTITNGIRNMPAYGRQIGVEDRWAIVAYVRALQESQGASMADVPPAEREALR